MFEFYPDAIAARQSHEAMQDQLCASLAILADHLSDTDTELPSQLSKWRADLQIGERLTTASFGLYYDIVDTAEAGDRHKAVELFHTLLDMTHAAPHLALRDLGSDIPAAERERIIAYMSTPETGAGGIGIPSPDKTDRFIATLETAIAWIDSELPDFAGELRALISEVIIVGPASTDGDEFEGGTCFRLWGSLALNAHRRASVFDLVISLVHEAGHARLFGLCQDEMLVENPDSERFWSPIRGHARPLEGIFHAAFVSARMVWAIECILARAKLNWFERRKLVGDLNEARRIYFGSLDTLVQNARFTPTGRAVFAAMNDFMSPETLRAEPVSCP